MENKEELETMPIEAIEHPAREFVDHRILKTIQADNRCGRSNGYGTDVRSAQRRQGTEAEESHHVRTTGAREVAIEYVSETWMAPIKPYIKDRKS